MKERVAAALVVSTGKVCAGGQAGGRASFLDGAFFSLLVGCLLPCAFVGLDGVRRKAGWQRQEQQQQDLGGEPAALKLKGLKSVRTALQEATKLNPTNANAWENLALLHEYDSRRRMMQHSRLVAKKGKTGDKDSRHSSAELERQLTELAAAAAKARSNAREAMDVVML